MEYDDLEPSMLQSEDQNNPPYQSQPAQIQEQQSYPEYQYQDYQQYEPTGISSDTITEISEQVVSEKLSAMQDKLEKAINFRNIAETKLSSLDERLRRIEQILDRLQLSILQKVGEYVADVKDIKKEFVETQKSLKKLSPGLRKSSFKEGKGKVKKGGEVP